MPPISMPDQLDDGPLTDDFLNREGLLPLDAETLQKLGLDELPELDLKEFGITLRDPAEPLSPPAGTTTHQTADGTAFWFAHRMAGDMLPIQIDVVTPENSVGYARIMCFEEGVLALADVRLESSHRRRGMGSALVRHIIALARKHGLQRISGFVVEDDLNETPSLRNWYVRLGFLVTPATDEDRARPYQKDAVALLNLELWA